jgi:hypothetical protein
MISSQVKVKGLRELSAVIARTSKDASRDLRTGLRAVAEPIRVDAERLAETRIRNIGPQWGKMRVGVTRRMVYVAPRKRGVKNRGADPRRRPQFATLLEQRAMTPALRQNEHRIEQATEEVFADLSRKWNGVRTSAT